MSQYNFYHLYHFSSSSRPAPTGTITSPYAYANSSIVGQSFGKCFSSISQTSSIGSPFSTYFPLRNRHIRIQTRFIKDIIIVQNRPQFRCLQIILIAEMYCLLTHLPRIFCPCLYYNEIRHKCCPFYSGCSFMQNTSCQSTLSCTCFNI